jgi:UDP-2-acetamido-2-deoxy-ribo-hexuluronate aminotransferase
MMERIQMVDLHRQYLNIKNEIDTAIQDVINSSEFIKGKKVNEFENNLAAFLGISNVIACANGTDALQLALMSLGLQPGDEVITTPFTFVSTVEVIVLMGLKPVFVDVEEDTFNIDPSKIDSAVTSKTRAIIPVHLFGLSCNMNKIIETAGKYNISVIEDAAQSLGSNYTYPDGKILKTGTIGTIGCTSFFPSKTLGCFGDGGAIFTNNNEIAGKIRVLANHGMKLRYHYDEIGINSRLDTIQAAVLDIKLKYLESYIAARRDAANSYSTKLKDVKELKLPLSSKEHVFHQFTMLVKNSSRDDLKKYLESRDIPCMIYYPIPLHLQKAYQQFGYKQGDFPVSEQLSKCVLSLPMHTELEVDQLEYICSSISEFFRK